jgi:FAD/FMN-containing dehydrogenase
MALEFRTNHTPLVAPGGLESFALDMTMTVSADVTLSAAQAKLAEVNQWLPIDGDIQSAVGELVENNSTGPLRLGYGGWRDLLLGVQFLNGKGELITAGGRTVKNVAGYDLSKFMVGQRGIFGRLVTLTTRTYRRPTEAVLARFPAEVTFVNTLMPSPLRPQWCLLTPDSLFCGYLGDERTVEFYRRGLPQRKLMELRRRPMEEDISHRVSLWSGAANYRAAVAPAKIPDFIERAGVQKWAADAAFGIVKIFQAADFAKLKEAAQAVGGKVFGESPRLQLDRVYNEAERALLVRLKQAFDPDGKLEPLEF